MGWEHPGLIPALRYRCPSGHRTEGTAFGREEDHLWKKFDDPHAPLCCPSRHHGGAFLLLIHSRPHRLGLVDAWRFVV